MKVQTFASLLFSLICASPVLAAPSPNASTPATAASAPELAANGDGQKPATHADELVCKRVEVTGSHLGKERVCKTRKAWEQEAEDNDDQNSRDHDLIDNRGSQNVPR